MKINLIALTPLLLLSHQVWAADVINHKSPYCGCCTAWTEHMQEEGFTVKEKLHDNMNDIKKELGITPQLASCHTAEIYGYIFEGHIPAKDIKAFLANPPKGAKGLAVPGMPIGSPGMENGAQKQAYTVYAFNQDGQVLEYQTYPKSDK
ncbi:DUF411 domain-containing protein [Vibrio sp. OCN044]|uniref:DUF411 domain-containing protein n=1 Tax=Vibrio tetraodonis subsp. pristinus TaxID=2695891 RepID=A0A6L8LP60_9VIBR|nr:DUF411 domain-containing protein [Vibrio tetraodonis]MYM57817.1 DUF411 domain-containing protein [Vibrio tetraodonis subsp. pristinus]